MSKEQILEFAAKNRIVENIIKNIARGELPHNLDDLAQDIYLALFEKEDELLNKLYNDGELEFYIYRMLANQIFSNGSPYFRKYKFLAQHSVELHNI